MTEFFAGLMDKIESTQILEQFETFDAVGLFTNPWFLVPFIGLLIYMGIKQQYTNIAIWGVCILVWVFMGSPFVEGLIDDRGFIQLNKVLPIIAVGVVALSVVIYLLFIRSD